MSGTTLVEKIHEFAAQAGDTDRVLAQGTVTALQAATAAKTAADANVSNVSVSGTTMTVTKGTGEGATSETYSVGATYNEATTSTSGLMSATDKAKLDGIGAMTGATSGTAGTAGLVPAPAAGDEDKFLRGDGTYATPPDSDTTYSVATPTTDGLMSAEDKAKLDGIEDGATAGGSADTNDCVKLTGTQTIEGTKTFTGSIIYFDNEMTAQFKAASTDNLSTVSKYSAAFGIRNYNTSLMRMTYGKATNNKAYLSIYCYGLGTASSTGGNGQLGLEIHPDSTEYAVQPSNDNQANLGIATRRWKQVYAGTASISTSDERTKQSLATIPDAVLDAWAEVNWQQFRFNDAVAEKGDNARLHTGLVAQRILEVFQKHGLDATRYGLLCHDTWADQEEERDDSGNVTIAARPAGDLYSLRYTEALAMEAAYQRRRADRLEARLADMEGRLAALEAK